jgi:hypothetical protein
VSKMATRSQTTGHKRKSAKSLEKPSDQGSDRYGGSSKSGVGKLTARVRKPDGNRLLKTKKKDTEDDD